MNDLFYVFLEEVMHGVDSFNVFADYLEEGGFVEANQIRQRIIPPKFKELYFQHIYPDCVNITNEQLIQLYRNLHVNRRCKDTDKWKFVLKNVTKFQREIIEYLKAEYNDYGNYSLLHMHPSISLLRKTGKITKELVKRFKEKIEILRLIGRNDLANQIKENLGVIKFF